MVAHFNGLAIHNMQKIYADRLNRMYHFTNIEIISPEVHAHVQELLSVL